LNCPVSQSERRDSYDDDDDEIVHDSQNYYVPRVRTKLGEHAFSYAGPVVWNNLPEYIRAESDITRFKNILKTYFF